jgi:hypothetical protein
MDWPRNRRLSRYDVNRVGIGTVKGTLAQQLASDAYNFGAHSVTIHYK